MINGQHIRLDPYSKNDHYLKQASNPDDNHFCDLHEYTFRVIRPCLAFDDINESDKPIVSLQSIRLDGHYYIRHDRKQLKISKHNTNGDNTFNLDASFIVHPAMNNDKACVSFESTNYRGHFICLRADGTLYMKNKSQHEGHNSWCNSASFKLIITVSSFY